VLERLGCATGFDDSTMRITVPDGIGSEAPYDLVRQMRASIVVLGPLLARRGHARVAMPGGCNIGSRKIDLHLKGLERMGATIGFDHGYLDAGGGLHGTEIALDWPSHGATENLMMAATLAKGTTIIENAARDPEIADLAVFLTSMGARIAGAGSPIITIEGVEELRATEHAVVPDRLEAGTLLIAAAVTRGDVLVQGARAEHLDIVLSKLADAGADVIATTAGVRLVMSEQPRAVDFVTLPYPGFPTDLQPMAIALNSIADGVAFVTENIFEGRFMFIDELLRLGADVRTDGHHAIVRGHERLSGAPVRATDIRAGAALVLAGLMADGTTTISDVHHVDRGYERFVESLQALGARIERREDATLV